MQVLLFMGDVAKPSNNFDNVIGSLQAPPSEKDVAWAVSKAMQGEFGYSRPAHRVDFADAFVFEGGSSLKKLFWKVGHARRVEDLTTRNFVHPWQDDEGNWHAVQSLDPLEAAALAQ
jgi:hypothetical protein